MAPPFLSKWNLTSSAARCISYVIVQCIFRENLMGQCSTALSTLCQWTESQSAIIYLQSEIERFHGHEHRWRPIGFDCPDCDEGGNRTNSVHIETMCTLLWSETASRRKSNLFVCLSHEREREDLTFFSPSCLQWNHRYSCSTDVSWHLRQILLQADHWNTACQLPDHTHSSSVSSFGASR